MLNSLTSDSSTYSDNEPETPGFLKQIKQRIEKQSLAETVDVKVSPKYIIIEQNCLLKTGQLNVGGSKNCKYCNESTHAKEDCWALNKISNLCRTKEQLLYAIRVWLTILDCEK